MKIFQVDFRKDGADYAYLTLFLLSKSKLKPTSFQIDTFLKLMDEIDLKILSFDEGLDIEEFGFGIEELNEMNNKIITTLVNGESIYIKDPWGVLKIDNFFSDNGKIIIVSRNGDLSYL